MLTLFVVYLYCGCWDFSRSTFHVAGGLIHLLLIIAVISLVMHFLDRPYMNISSSWVAESTLLLCRPRPKVATMAEIPAAMPLTSRTGRRTALFTVPETFSICLMVASTA